MTREQIEKTEWGLRLWESTTPSTYREIVKRMAIQTPVFIAWMGDSAEITLGSYTIHSTATMEDAITWCQQFELPVQAQASNDIVPKLLEWLDEQGNDRTLATAERAAYFNVQAKVNQLMKEKK